MFFTQLLRIMRITAFLLLAVAVHVSAKTVSQTITFSGKEVTLKQVFNAVRAQTDFGIIYNKSWLNDARPVTIHAVNQPLAEFLKIAFASQPLEFSIEKKTIVVKKKEVSSVPVFKMEAPPVTGIVRGPDGQPLAGVNIVVKGTKRGVVSNADGSFGIEAKEGEVLVVSSVGYSQRILTIDHTNTVGVIEMAVSDSKLDEVQIVAYGTTSKRLLTGNISSVKQEEISQQPVTNPLLALQGRTTGVFIEQSTGLPGSDIKIRIQGQNSISKGNEPLYVIDGVPYTSQLLPTVGTSLGGNGNPLNFINPLDIASIDILKDADATSIYGSRAANGAVLITTKKGVSGETKLNVNMRSGWGKVTRKIDLLNTQEYVQMRLKAFEQDEVSPMPTDYDVNGIWNQNRYTDWQKVLTGGTARYTDINVNLSGGSVQTNFLIAATYHKQTTVFPSDYSDKKGSLHFNLNNVSNDQRFRFSFFGNYMFDDNQLPGTPDLTNTAITLPPNAPSLYNADGSLNWAQVTVDDLPVSTWTNPLALLERKFYSKTNNLASNSVISYSILPGLEVKANLGYTFMQTKEVQISPSTIFSPEERRFYNRASQFGNNTISSWLVEPQVSCKRNIGPGRLEALAGVTFQNNTANGLRLEAKGFNSDVVMEDIKAATTITPFVGGGTMIYTYRYNAVFGRAGYNIADKYLFNFSARRDGSSRFGSNNRFHNFGSAGAAWIFSKERFVGEELPFISFGKLKGSYGTTGNDQIGDYQFLSLYTPTTVDLPYQNAGGLQITSLPNPYFQWEETRKFSAGIDLGFVNDRFMLNANYYRNRSSNQLVSTPLATSTGFGSILSNLPATVQNTGWELSATTNNINGKYFDWSSSFNLTIPKNKLVSFPGLASSTYAETLVEGQPVDITKMFHFTGVNPATGLYEFSSAQGEPTSFPDFFADRTTMLAGMNMPELYGGFQNTFRYKGFTLDILFSFVKQKGRNYLYGTGAAGVKQNQPRDVLNSWQKPGDDAPVQRYVTVWNFTNYFPTFYLMQSDAMYGEASYIRLKNLNVSFDIPERIVKRIKMQNARLYIQGQNLLTITDYKGLDPENRSSSLLPPLRIITTGIQLSL